MRYLIYLTFALIITQTFGQGSHPCYDDFMNEANLALLTGDFAKAKDRYECAVNCPDIQPYPTLREAANDSMQKASRLLLNELSQRNQRSQFQAYMQSDTALSDPTEALAIAWQFLQSPAGKGNPEVEATFTRWYQSHSFYAHTLEPRYTGEELMAMEWEGNYLATVSRVSNQGIIRIWDPINGELLEERVEEEGIIYDVIFDREGDEPDPQVLYIGYNPSEKEVFMGIWRWENGPDAIDDFSGIDDEVAQIIEIFSWMPDNRHLLLGGQDGKAYILNYQSEIVQAEMTLFKRAIRSIDLVGSEDSTIVILASQDGEAKLLLFDQKKTGLEPFGFDTFVYGDAEADHQGNELNAHAHRAVFLPYDEKQSVRVVVGGCSNRIAIYNSPFIGEEKQLISVITGFEGDISTLKTPDNGKYIMAGDYTGQVKITDEDAVVKFNLEGHHAKIIDIRLSPDQEWFATASEDGIVRIWNIGINQRGDRVGSMGISEGDRHTAAASPGGRYIFASHEFHNFESGEFGEDAKRIRKHIDGDKLLALDAWGEYFLINEDNNVSLYDLNSELHQVYTGFKAEVTSIAWSENRAWIAAGSEDKSVRVWDAWSGDSLFVLTGHKKAVNALILGADTSLIISAGGYVAKVWNSKGEWIQDLKGIRDRISSLHLSKGGSQIFIGYQSGVIQLFRRSGKHEPFIPGPLFLGHKGPIISLDFKPEQGYLLSTSEDLTARVWNSEGNLISVFSEDQALRKGIWAKIQSDEYIMLMTESRIPLYYPLRGYAESVSEGKIQGLSKESTYLNFLKIGIEVPLDTLLDTTNQTQWTAYADFLYNQSKELLFSDTTSLTAALQLYEAAQAQQDSLSPEQIRNLLDCYARLNIVVLDIPTEAFLGAGKYYFERALESPGSLSAEDDYRRTIQYLRNVDVTSVHYSERGKLMVYAYHQLDSTCQTLDDIVYLQSRTDILDFASQVTEIAFLQPKSETNQVFLRQTVEALEKIPVKLGQGRLLAALVETYLHLGDSAAIAEVGTNIKDDYLIEFVEYFERRTDEVIPYDEDLAIEYLVAILNCIEQAPALQERDAGVGFQEQYALLSEAYLERGQADKALDIWKRGVSRGASTPDPQLRAIEGYARLVKGQADSIAYHILYDLSNVPVEDDNGNRTIMAELILKQLTRLEELGHLEAEVMPLVNGLRDQMIFGMSFEEILATKSTGFLQAGYTHYKDLVEISQAYTTKSEYQDRIVQIVSVFPVNQSIRDSILGTEYGNLCYWLALSGQAEQSMQIYQDALRQRLDLSDYPEAFALILKARIINHILLKERDEWRALYEGYADEKYENLTYRTTFLSDLRKLRQEGLETKESEYAMQVLLGGEW